MATSDALTDDIPKFLARMRGVTGVNPLWLERAARSGLLNLETATADDVYRVASQLANPRPTRQLELPIGPQSQEPDIRALIPRESAGQLAPIDPGYRGYSIPGAPERPAGLATVNRDIATLPRGIAKVDPGYRQGVPVDVVGEEDLGIPLGPMTGRGLPYVNQEAAAQARYRQRTSPAVEYGNELDAARRFREATTDPESSFVDRVQDVVRNGADAIASGARTAGNAVAGAGRRAVDSVTRRVPGEVVAGSAIAGLAAGGLGRELQNLSAEEPAVSSGGEAELADTSRPAPAVAATKAASERPALTSTAGQDDNLEASATPVSPGALRRQMQQMPIERPTPATDMGDPAELQLIDGNAHLARPAATAMEQPSSPTPSQLTADYRKERSMYDLARRSGKSIEELRKLPEFANVGAMRGGDYTRADGTTGTMRSAAARDIAAQARINDERDRMDRWKAQMLLSSSNQRANNANAFNMLSPEAQQRVIESRFTHGGNAPAMDPRVQAAMVEAQARADAQREALAVERERIDAGRDTAGADREERQAARRLQEKIAADSNATANRQIDVNAGTTKDARDIASRQFYDELLARLGLQRLQGDQRIAEIKEDRAAKSQLPPSAEALNQFTLQEKQNAQSQAALDWAEKNIKKRYASDSGLMNWVPGWSSQFTAREQRNAYDDLKAQFPQLEDGQIRNIIRSIAARKDSEPASY